LTLAATPFLSLATLAAALTPLGKSLASRPTQPKPTPEGEKENHLTRLLEAMGLYSFFTVKKALTF
jgi:hypothetical protein